MFLYLFFGDRAIFIQVMKRGSPVFQRRAGSERSYFSEESIYIFDSTQSSSRRNSLAETPSYESAEESPRSPPFPVHARPLRTSPRDSSTFDSDRMAELDRMCQNLGTIVSSSISDPVLPDEVRDFLNHSQQEPSELEEAMNILHHTKGPQSMDIDDDNSDERVLTRSDSMDKSNAQGLPGELLEMLACINQPEAEGASRARRRSSAKRGSDRKGMVAGFRGGLGSLITRGRTRTMPNRKARSSQTLEGDKEDNGKKVLISLSPHGRVPEIRTRRGSRSTSANKRKSGSAPGSPRIGRKPQRILSAHGSPRRSQSTSPTKRRSVSTPATPRSSTSLKHPHGVPSSPECPRSPVLGMLSLHRSPRHSDIATRIRRESVSDPGSPRERESVPWLRRSPRESPSNFTGFPIPVTCRSLQSSPQSPRKNRSSDGLLVVKKARGGSAITRMKKYPPPSKALPYPPPSKALPHPPHEARAGSE